MKHRICWKIGFMTGNGAWYGDLHLELLEKHVIAGNEIHGAGTHWIESEIE